MGKACERYIERLNKADRWIPSGPIRGPIGDYHLKVYEEVKNLIAQDKQALSK